MIDLWYPRSFSHTIKIDEIDGKVCFLFGECWGMDASACEANSVPDFERIVESPGEIKKLIDLKGEGVLPDLDGIYVYMQYDKREESVLIYSDYLGLKPFFFTQIEGGVVGCSEFQPISRLFGNKRINKKAIASYFMYGMPFNGETFINDIDRLQPSSRLYLKNGKVFITRVSSNNTDIRTKLSSLDDAIDTCHRMCSSLMNRQLSDGKIEYFPITGGYDTRVILSLFGSKREQFTWTTNCSPFLSEETDKDVIIAKKICSLYGLRHNVRVSSKSESDVRIEGNGLYEEIRFTEDSINLNGHFSYYVRGTNALFHFAKNSRKGILPEALEQICEKNIYQDSSDLLFAVIDQYMRGCVSTFVGFGSGNFLSQMSFFQRSFRSPFLGASLHKFLTRLPYEEKCNGKLYLGMLKKFAPELLAIPFASRINSDPSIKILEEGVNYYVARKVDLYPALRSYLCSLRTYRRGIYRHRFLLMLWLKFIFEYLLPPTVGGKAVNHWRYKKLLPYDMFDMFIKIECMLRDYYDK